MAAGKRLSFWEEVTVKGFYLEYDLRTNSLKLIKTNEKKKLFILL